MRLDISLELMELKLKLDSISDSLNAEIDEAEKQLNSLGMGVTAWVQASPGIKVGYTKYCGTWRIVATAEEFVKEGREFKIWALTSSPRRIRLIGFRAIPNLIPEIEKEANKLINNLNEVIDESPGTDKHASEV